VIVTTLLEIMQLYLEGSHTYQGGSNNTLVKTNSGLHDLYSSPNITLVMKPRRMRRKDHVVRMHKRKVEFWSDNLKKEDHVKDSAVDRRIML
jgi:hypothetical protein